MAGFNVDSAPAGRRPIDSEINMIPMIDLLVSCIAFLLITAVWSQMARIQASALVPGDPTKPLTTQAPDPTLHVEIKSPDAFSLVWRQGSTILSTTDVPRQPVEAEIDGVRHVRYPGLAARVQIEWSAHGAHRGTDDPKYDQAVLHARNGERFSELVAVIDAIHSVRRASQDTAMVVSFAADD